MGISNSNPMSENAKCKHIPRVRVEVDHEGMDMSWLECVVCGKRLYVSEETPETIASLRAEVERLKAERKGMVRYGQVANLLDEATEYSSLQFSMRQVKRLIMLFGYLAERSRRSRQTEGGAK